MQKVTSEHSSFLNLQNENSTFGREKEVEWMKDRTCKRETLLLQIFWGTGEDTNREVGRGRDENWEVGWEDKVKDRKRVY